MDFHDSGLDSANHLLPDEMGSEDEREKSVKHYIILNKRKAEPT